MRFIKRFMRPVRPSSVLLDRLLPHHCPICFTEILQNGLCGNCWNQMAFIYPPYCDRCGKPLHSPAIIKICGRCMQDRPTKERIRATLHYDEAARQLILPFKHGDRLELAPLIARLMLPAFEELITDDHLILPIPLHLWRRLKRRYNQSTEIARHLCRFTGREAQLSTTILQRAHHTASLARHNAKKRQLILKDAFIVKNTKRLDLSKRPILLIDDVITTGATMDAASRALRRKGVNHIDSLSFARIL